MSLFTPSALLVAVLMGAASTAGLLLDPYRDNPLVQAAWRGNDLVTLVVAVPLLLGTVVGIRQGSTRARLIGLGLLAYAAYNYAFYLFGAAFNSLFLVYVGILAASTLGLIGGLGSGVVRPAVDSVSLAGRDRMAGGLILAVCLLLGLFWTAMSVRFVLTGEVPALVTLTDHPTNVTGALDLWLVVTFGVLGGSWLLRGRPWGVIVSTVWAVKGAVYMVALSSATVSAYLAGTTPGVVELALWLPIGIACAVAASVLLRRGGPTERLR